MHTARDGVRLSILSSEPAAQPARGSILLTHGMGEHTGRYLHVIERFNAAGLNVLAWDLRGHGRSEGPRGDIPDYSAVLDDLAEVWSLAASGPTPIFLYGHSLGAQITLNFAVRDRPTTAGLIITSAWLRLAFVPSRLKLGLAWVAARVWPSFTQDTDMVPSRLSRDIDFLMAMPDPELAHHRMSARMYEALSDGARRAFRDSVQLPYPILLLHGSDDPITCVDATKQLFHDLQSRDKSLVIIPQGLHEPHNDVDREMVLARITEWIEARLRTANCHLDPH
jgi:alpha-beta hydrolase superfamily lysophospholipase